MSQNITFGSMSLRQTSWISRALFGGCFLIVISLSISSPGADKSTFAGRFQVGQKAEKKEASRWSLQDWLAQKERNQLMDLWLAMYSPSPYEFFIGGSSQSYTSSSSPKATEAKDYQSISGRIGAYATIIGLEGSYENNTSEGLSDIAGSLNLRILGNAVQGTHLHVFYGLRHRSTDISGHRLLLRNQFAGADLNLYVTRYFGLLGNYRHYFPFEDSTVGTIAGSRTEAGIFIDFSAVRIFGNYFSDLQTQEQSGASSTVDRTGFQTGLLFFF